MKKETINNVSSILTFILAVCAVGAFWKFIADGDVFDNWYPLVGAFIASHGALIGILLWQYLNVKKRTFAEQWSIWFGKTSVKNNQVKVNNNQMKAKKQPLKKKNK